MKRTLYVCALAGLVALAVGSASELEGTWEGKLEGVKAITLTLRESGGQVSGRAVFFIIRDEGSGKHNGAGSPPISLQDVRSDGAVLHFFVKGSNGQPLAMDMKITGPARAELTRQWGGGLPALTISLEKQ